MPTEPQKEKRMQRGDKVRFVKDGKEVEATITDFAPRLFDGLGGCNVETDKGWVVSDDLTGWEPRHD